MAGGKPPQVAIGLPATANNKDKVDRLFTVGTECNAVIAYVAKYSNGNIPAYTRPFYNRLCDDPTLQANCKIHLLALKRSTTNPETFWDFKKMGNHGKEYPVYWQLFIRFLTPNEPNTAEFRSTWGKSLAEILNRFGAGYDYEQKNRHEADLGMGVLGDYCTYPVTFKRIEDEYFEKNFSNQDIADDTDLLGLYFGDDETTVQNAQQWYRTRTGLAVAPAAAADDAEQHDDLNELALNLF
jgi:hypothetical protein